MEKTLLHHDMMRAWFDPRSLLLTVLLALAAALPAITTSVENRNYYFFDITLTSTSQGSTQFFWDLGDGFTEYNSSRQPIKVETEPVVYRFMMPMGRFTALRFDPIDGVGQFTFSHAQIVDRRDRIVHVFGPEDLLPGGNITRAKPRGMKLDVVTSQSSNDPILNLRLVEPLVLKPDARIWWELGWPAAWPVLLLGCLLSCPLVARGLSRSATQVLAYAESRPASSIMLTAVIMVAIQCHPVLFQGRSFASPNNGGHMLYESLPTLPGYTDAMSANTGSSDTGALLFQHLYYPMVQRDALAAGELPLWNRYSLSGEPLLGQGQSMFGDPFNFITIATDGAAWAWDIRFLIVRWLLAGSLGGIVWLLTRRIGPAVLTTIGAGFLGFFTYRLVHPANFSVCYSPLILLAWCGLHGTTTPRGMARWLAALVAANWLVLTSGTVKEAYMLIVCLNLAGVILLLLRSDTAGRRSRLLGAASLAGFGFILITAPNWISFLSAWAHSMTGYDVPQANTLTWSHFVGFFDDIFYRQTQNDENVVAPALNFLFFSGFLWWLVQPRAWRTTRTGWALLLASAVPFSLAFGLVPTSVIEKIPFVGNIVHVGNTFSCILLSLLGVFAGVGFADAWAQLGKSEARPAMVRYWLLALLIFGLYFLTTRESSYSHFFVGYAISLGVVLMLLPLGLHWGLANPTKPGPVWIMLALGLPLLCWRHSQYRESAFDHFVFIPGPRADLHAPSPAITLLKRNLNEPGRVNGWGSTLYASYNTALGLEGVYGVDAVRSQQYHELADALGLQRVWNWDWPNRESDSRDLIKKYDLYNVTHWVATHRDGDHPIDGLQLLGQADLDVYASPTAWPRAFYCNGVLDYDTPADFARLLLTGDGRPFAAVQTGDESDLPRLNAAAKLIQPAIDYRFTPNSTSFTIDAPGPGVAVLTETYYREDFQVTVNGQPADYFRLNHAFRGIRIPSAGAYEITFNYWPQYFTLALWLAFVGAMGLVGGLVWLLRPNASFASQPVL
ncbi:MAG: YfhO family protein [Cephaloticoccus sp.]|nr:YfhO family protein [Cephaloticoccus sp.]